MATHQTEVSLRTLCDWIAAHPQCNRSDIQTGLCRKQNVSESTVYRWLALGIERNLIRRNGNTSSSTYEASDQLRIEMIRRQLSIDHKKRNRVGYNEDWLNEYEPNKTTYLKQADIARLHARCSPGSAHISKLDDHDVSMFMCDLSYASSRLEGNDYDYANTIQLAEHEIEKRGGSAKDKAMILNHRDAVRYIIDSTKENDLAFGVNQHVLRGIHAILSHDLMTDPMMCGGLRTQNIEIWKSSYIPIDIPEQICKNFEKIALKAAQIKDPYEQSFFLLVHIPYLQPFLDCNKRTSRVICNIPLLQGGVTPISWMDVTDRPKDYTDAIIAVYEHNDTLLLAELFVETFMRSSERFGLLQRQKNPDPIASTYRTEIKASIRAKVLDGVDHIPPTVDEDDTSDYIDYVVKELRLLKLNNMLGIRYGLTPVMLDLRDDSELDFNVDYGVDLNQQREKMR